MQKSQLQAREKNYIPMCGEVQSLSLREIEIQRLGRLVGQRMSRYDGGVPGIEGTGVIMGG
jgi:hypothetical protein